MKLKVAQAKHECGLQNVLDASVSGLPGVGARCEECIEQRGGFPNIPPVGEKRCAMTPTTLDSDVCCQNILCAKAAGEHPGCTHKSIKDLAQNSSGRGKHDAAPRPSPPTQFSEEARRPSKYANGYLAERCMNAMCCVSCSRMLASCDCSGRLPRTWGGHNGCLWRSSSPLARSPGTNGPEVCGGSCAMSVRKHVLLMTNAV